MKPLREVVENIIGQYIPKDKWDETFKELNSEGRPDLKELKAIILELCKRVEALETSKE